MEGGGSKSVGGAKGTGRGGGAVAAWAGPWGGRGHEAGGVSPPHPSRMSPGPGDVGTWGHRDVGRRYRGDRRGDAAPSTLHSGIPKAVPSHPTPWGPWGTPCLTL